MWAANGAEKAACRFGRDEWCGAYQIAQPESIMVPFKPIKA